ncbi:hypothetical protein PENVUL_c003G05215 [Penicillium vulpinum]|uniref:Zn(2)-C6 fungal-type domain-containing protein n=1 Tax=Penicillium vulpinum TaxID=29845 RepID=A0A1V6SBR0_9EURO|nr:hypothetical protein PENVUL_c003G05215 [Penicillium vulpinum]
MDSTALRRIQGPSGITKTNKQGRRPGKIACTACHARKKRCDIAPPYHQCTHCRKEDQVCVPRDSIERPTRPQVPKRNNTQKPSKSHENKSPLNGFLPRGIDHHEIPRWSALYSSYSEICRLLPPLTPTSASPSPSPEIEEDIAHAPTIPNKRKRDASSSGLDSSKRFQSDVLHTDRAQTASIKGISIPASQSPSRSPSPAPLEEKAGLEKALGCEAEVLHGGPAPARERLPSRGDSSSNYAVFMNDLDALLRF